MPSVSPPEKQIASPVCPYLETSYKEARYPLSSHSAQDKLTLMNISIFVQGQTEEMPKHAFSLSSQTLTKQGKGNREMGRQATVNQDVRLKLPERHFPSHAFSSFCGLREKRGGGAETSIHFIDHAPRPGD